MLKRFRGCIADPRSKVFALLTVFFKVGVAGTLAVVVDRHDSCRGSFRRVWAGSPSHPRLAWHDDADDYRFMGPVDR